MGPTSRRRLLLAAVLAPVVLLVARFGDLIRAVGGALRPPASGSSATRCAACGAADHAMLDPGCPATPRVRPGARA